MADEAKLKEIEALIEAKEKEKFSAFISIGKKYYELNAQKKEPAYAQWVNLIDSADEEIQNLEGQKSEIRGFYICECGTEVPTKLTFCPECGKKIAKVKVAIPDGFTQCPQCASLVAIGTKFCGTCGGKMGVKAAAEEPVVEEVVMEEDSQDDSVKRCAVCNEVLDKGAAFCFKCGTKVSK